MDVDRDSESSTVGLGEDRQRRGRIAGEGRLRSSRLGRYVLLERAGTGGMGVVYRAYDPRLRREVALKQLHDERLPDGGRNRLLSEAQALARLAHPNVVSVFDVEATASGVVMAMEYVPGQTLKRWLGRRRSFEDIVAAFVQAGRGLAHAHDAGIVHRDFKPSNVLVGDDGRVRVMDFGLAHARAPAPRVSSHADTLSEASSVPNEGTATDDAGMPRLDVVVGTVAYMPPEQQFGELTSAKADQYAFCVSLWEALAGHRPFHGDMRTMLSEKLDGAPPWPEHRTPAAVVAAIRRGLEVQPSRRFPTMHPLLAVLEAAIAAQRWRPGPWFVGGAVLLLGVGVTAGRWHADGSTCTDEAASLEGTWDDERRERVRHALLSTGAVFAEETWTRVETLLDGYAQAWQDARLEVCRQRSPELFDRQIQCLRARETELHALVDVLTTADRQTVEKAIPIASRLRSLDPCFDPVALTADVAPPDDPEVAQAVDEARARLARVQALLNAGNPRLAEDALTDVEPDVRALPYPPLQAEFDYRRGAVSAMLGRADAAQTALERAYATALEHGHLDVATQTALELVGVTRNGKQAGATARAWAQQGLQLARRKDVAGPEVARALNIAASLDRAAGRYDDAERRLRDALALATRVLGPMHPDTAAHVNNLANVAVMRGDYEAARDQYRSVLEIWRNTLGPQHPKVASALGNLGAVLFEQGDFDAAADYARQAADIAERSLGPDHPDVCVYLGNLANARSAAGAYEEALRLHQRVLRIRSQGRASPLDLAALHTNVGSSLLELERIDDAEQHLQRAIDSIRTAQRPGTHYLEALALNNLGVALQRRDQPQRAEHLHRRSLEIYRATLGPDHALVAAAHNNLGSALRALGRLPEATAAHRSALDIALRQLGPSHENTAYILIEQGRTLSAAGEEAEARDAIERALRIRKLIAAPPRPLADAQLALAELLVSTPGYAQRCRSLADEARRNYLAAGEAGRSGLRRVDAFVNKL